MMGAEKHTNNTQKKKLKKMAQSCSELQAYQTLSVSVDLLNARFVDLWWLVCKLVVCPLSGSQISYPIWLAQLEVC